MLGVRLIEEVVGRCGSKHVYVRAEVRDCSISAQTRKASG
jgi:hypothetical protein